MFWEPVGVITPSEMHHHSLRQKGLYRETNTFEPDQDFSWTGFLLKLF